VSTADWIKVALEGAVVIGFIALGVRTGGIGVGLWGGVGTAVLVFGFGLAPGDPPTSAMLIVIAVISAAAAMQAAGGIDYMVVLASRALRAKPRALVSPLRDRFSIEVADGEDMEAKGNILDHEYKVERDGHHVAEVSKRWFRVRDTYGIEIAPDQDDALILAVTVCIDQMARG
jgi:hypothetical protein